MRFVLACHDVGDEGSSWDSSLAWLFRLLIFRITLANKAQRTKKVTTPISQTRSKLLTIINL